MKTSIKYKPVKVSIDELYIDFGLRSLIIKNEGHRAIVSTKETYIGELDKDELDEVIKKLTKLKDEMYSIPGEPDTNG